MSRDGYFRKVPRELGVQVAMDCYYLLFFAQILGLVRSVDKYISLR